MQRKRNDKNQIPEVEINYEKFGAKALEVAEKYLNLTRIAKVAAPIAEVELDYKAFIKRFKKILMTDL